MRIRMIIAVVTGVALFLAVSTQDLRATTPAIPGSNDELHVVGTTELHDAVVNSSAQAATARKAVQDFLAQSEVRSQLERIGFDSTIVASRVALLDDSEILRLQSQVMPTDQQFRTAGFPGWAIVLIIVGVAMVILVATQPLGD